MKITVNGVERDIQTVGLESVQLHSFEMQEESRGLGQTANEGKPPSNAAALKEEYLNAVRISEIACKDKIRAALAEFEQETGLRVDSVERSAHRETDATGRQVLIERKIVIGFSMR